MLQTKKTTIGSHTYKVTQLNAVAGRRALTRLGRVIGPALESLQSAGEKGGLAVFGKLVSALDEGDTDYFCDLFAEQTSVSGPGYPSNAEPQLDAVFSMHFAGRYGDMVKWLAFCFQVNFGSFFAEAGLFAKDKPAPTEEEADDESPSISPTAWIGSSGDS